jgi:hypothetical protein
VKTGQYMDKDISSITAGEMEFIRYVYMEKLHKERRQTGMVTDIWALYPVYKQNM